MGPGIRLAGKLPGSTRRGLKPDLGDVVGYKAGLTSKPLQERFGVTGPVRGRLLAGMLLKDGATVPAAFGARPL